MREGLTRARRRVVQSAGAVLGIATIAAIAFGFSGQILFKPTAAASRHLTDPRARGAPAVPSAAGIRASPDTGETARLHRVDVDATGARPT